MDSWGCWDLQGSHTHPLGVPGENPAMVGQLELKRWELRLFPVSPRALTHQHSRKSHRNTQVRIRASALREPLGQGTRGSGTDCGWIVPGLAVI